MHSSNPVTVLTDVGAERLRLELSHLERTARPEISAAIGRARAHGDLSENAEYHAAKEKQGFIEARIGVLRSALANARIVELASLNPGERIDFGMVVDLCALTDNNRTMTYQIVGELESNPEEGRISHSSPVAKALLRKQEGDIIDIKLPAGTVTYEILRVRVP